MSSLRAALKLSAVLAAGTVLVPAQWVMLRFGRPTARHIPGTFHRIVCRTLGIRIHVSGTPAEGRPLLLAANHVSWLDIPIIGALMPLSFVAKAEVEGWPVFGLLARLQRTIFVDRTRRSRTGIAAAAIADRLGGGDPVVLFAEGTSSDGNRVLPFRSALIGATGEAIGDVNGAAFVQPLAIAYLDINGVPMGRQFRSRAAWYGDMEMLPHLWQALRSGPIDVAVALGEPIPVGAGSDRKAIARRLEDEVRAAALGLLRGRFDRPLQKPPLRLTRPLFSTRQKTAMTPDLALDRR